MDAEAGGAGVEVNVEEDDMLYVRKDHDRW